MFSYLGRFFGMAAPLSTTMVAMRSGENKGQVLAVSESFNNIVLFSMLPLLSWVLSYHGLVTMSMIIMLMLTIAIVLSVLDIRSSQ